MCAWVCPKEECSNKQQMKKGDKCPHCGEEVKEFGFFDLKLLLEVKDKGRENVSNESKEKNKIPTFFPRDDEGLRPPPTNESILVSRQTASLENASVIDNLEKLLQSISKQNKTIIKQNKQIYELVKKNNSSP